MTATPGWYRVDEHWLRYWDGIRWTEHTQPAPAGGDAPAAPAASVPGAAPAPATREPRPAAPPRPPREPASARFVAGARRIGRLIASDLAVNWLSYLGVLLLVGGLFGFVVFSFAQIPVPARPAAEVAMPLLLVGAAAFLRARGARIAGSAVALAAGALLPVVVVAGLVDNAPFPPDLHGTALVLTAAALVGAVAAGYAAWSARRASPLRFLVGPALWLAAGLLGHLPAHTHPRGQAIAFVGVPHASLMLVAVAVSVLAARFAPRSVLGRATLVAAVPGAAIAATCAILAASRHGAGPGWLAVSFGAASIASAAFGVGAAGARRAVAQWASATFGATALIEAARLTSWTPEHVACVILVVFGVVVAAAALAVRAGRIVDWLGPWVLAPVGAVSVIGGVAAQGNAHGRLDAAAFAVAAAGLAAAAALLATPWQMPGLRRVATILTVGTAALAGAAAGLTAAPVAYGAAALAVLAAGVAGALVALDSGKAWRLPVADAAVAALAVAFGASASGHLAVAPVLWSAAAVAAAYGAITGRSWLTAAAPWPAWLGWLNFVASLGLHAPEWYALTAAVAILATVTVVRAARRRAELPAATGELVAAEYLAFVLAAAFPLVDIVRVGAVDGLLAIAVGVLLGVWGLVAEVRRRLVTGTAVVLAAMVTEAGVLLTGLWPALHGPAAWLAIACGGGLVLGAAAGLERARGRLKVGTRWAELVDGWE